MAALFQKPVVSLITGNDIRNNMGNASFCCLICLHITEPFTVEGIGILKEARCTAEYLRIACPSKTLISLRAVCWNIHEIALQSPENVVRQLIQILIRCLKESCTLHIGMDGICRKIVKGWLTREGNDLRIAESHKCK